MIDIHLRVGDQTIHFLSIPLHEIQNLAIRPFKWLRFVVFSICGAHGDLYATPNDSEPVDYDTYVTALVDGGSYFYRSLEDCIFVDQHGLSDRDTTSEEAPYCHRFSEAVIHRDGSCVATKNEVEVCDAAHLIPRSKGDEYIRVVFKARLARYEPMDLLQDINATQNGVLLRKDLHAMLGSANVAFLQTPNFAMGPSDIPRSEHGPMPNSRITLQRFKKPNDFNVHRCIDEYQLNFDRNGKWPRAGVCFEEGCDVDAQIGQESRPPAIILDFIYGVAAYRRWTSKSTASKTVMDDSYRRYYEPALHSVPSRSTLAEDSEQRDLDYDPKEQGKQGRTRGKKPTMADAMDEMNRFIMSLCGTTPEEVAAKREKKMEEEEQTRQEEGRSKVEEWIQGTHIVPDDVSLWTLVLFYAIQAI